MKFYLRGHNHPRILGIHANKQALSNYHNNLNPKKVKTHPSQYLTSFNPGHFNISFDHTLLCFLSKTNRAINLWFKESKFNKFNKCFLLRFSLNSNLSLDLLSTGVKLSCNLPRIFISRKSLPNHHQKLIDTFQSRKFNCDLHARKILPTQTPWQLWYSHQPTSNFSWPYTLNRIDTSQYTNMWLHLKQNQRVREGGPIMF